MLSGEELVEMRIGVRALVRARPEFVVVDVVVAVTYDYS